MSWRISVTALLLALSISTWIGIQLGNWLVEHTPFSVPPSGHKEANQEHLGANGRAYMAQPPQPRIDGTLGIPESTTTADWSVTTVVLSHSGIIPGTDKNNTPDSVTPSPGLSAESVIIVSPSFSANSLTKNVQILPVVRNSLMTTTSSDWQKDL